MLSKYALPLLVQSFHTDRHLEEPHCSDARGGLHSPQDSDDWQSMGTWELGLQHLGYGGAGDYGLDRITSTSTIQTGAEFSMDGVLMSVVNTTDYFLGQFGVGITQGNFGDTVAKSPLTSAVETSGLIPSYSYGYTAGAHYRLSYPQSCLGSHLANHVQGICRRPLRWEGLTHLDLRPMIPSSRFPRKTLSFGPLFAESKSRRMGPRLPPKTGAQM